MMRMGAVTRTYRLASGLGVVMAAAFLGALPSLAQSAGDTTTPAGNATGSPPAVLHLNPMRSRQDLPQTLPQSLSGASPGSPSSTAPSTPAVTTAAPPVAPPETATPATASPPATTGALSDTASASPVIAAAQKKLAEKSFAAKSDNDDVAALTAFYAGRAAPLWIKDGAFSTTATAVIEEIKKAGDWGLDASAFDVPDIAGASSEAQGEAEAKVSLAALKYARFARGGRVTPLSVSNIWDMAPPVKDAKDVITALSGSDTPAQVLITFHPKHPQFEKLRQALIKARGPQEETKIDEALKVKIPVDGSLKPGAEHDDVVLLRKRLKIEALSASNAKLYDARLEAAVRAFQEEKGLKVNGLLNARTRAALNAEGEPKRSNPKGEVDRILVNMERWRWLPEDLGQLHVMNNIPEFVGRVMKGTEAVWEERIIIGNRRGRRRSSPPRCNS